MKIYPFLKRLALMVIVAASAQRSHAQEERPIWQQEVMLVYSGTSTEFNRLRSLGKNNQRLALYTRALDILHEKVEVDEDEKPYEVAQGIFRIIISDNDEDAIGLASAYYLARIVQSNPYEQDIEEAKKLYWEIYERWPERFFAQMAVVKYATLHIYGDDSSSDDVYERIQELEPIIGKITIPELRQNMHRIVGEAYARFELDSTVAFEHLKEAHALGIPVASIRVEVLEYLAALGEEIGELERALQAYDELALIAPKHERTEEFSANAHRLRVQLGQVR